MSKIYDNEDTVQERIGFIVVDGGEDGEEKELYYGTI